MKSKQRLTTCVVIFCLLSSFISVSDNPSSPLSLLAPAAEALALTLSPKQKKQIQQLIQTLDMAEPLLQRRYAGLFWLTEDNLATYQEKIQNPKVSSIPRLGFYDFLGGGNREKLRKLFVETLQQSQPLPKKLELTCNSIYDDPVGLYWFLASIHEFKEEELNLFESVEIGSFHRDLSTLNMPKYQLNKTLAKLTGDDLKKGVEAFSFHGEKAKEVANLLFQKANVAAGTLGAKWEKESPLTLDLLTLVDKQYPVAVLAGVHKIVLNMEELLQLPQRSQQNILEEILYCLTEENVALGEKEVQQSELLLTAAPELFQQKFFFYNSLKILAKAALLSRANKAAATLSKNILNALQQGRPNWFQESLDFLDDEATFNDMISFLAATGWIDDVIQLEIQEKKTSSPYLKKIKGLLKNKSVATAETVAPEIFLRPKEQRRPPDQLQLFSRIKQSLFFSNKKFDDTSLVFVFLQPEAFSDDLTTALGLKAATEKLLKQIFDFDRSGGLLFFFKTMQEILVLPSSNKEWLWHLAKFMSAAHYPTPEIQLFFQSLLKESQELKKALAQNLKDIYQQIYAHAKLPSVDEIVKASYDDNVFDKINPTRQQYKKVDEWAPILEEIKENFRTLKKMEQWIQTPLPHNKTLKDFLNKKFFKDYKKSLASLLEESL